MAIKFGGRGGSDGGGGATEVGFRRKTDNIQSVQFDFKVLAQSVFPNE